MDRYGDRRDVAVRNQSIQDHCIETIQVELLIYRLQTVEALVKWPGSQEPNNAVSSLPEKQHKSNLPDWQFSARDSTSHTIQMILRSKRSQEIRNAKFVTRQQ